ncbi:type II toxin-antitoxin system PemK/MazF family toxin [Pseudomonas viridiflava]|uniref:type II toxin-antitoxin system PemK/MazF family toxin n=1 Tax=Pseudomonas viridiflava TaxID=33069 RepID=UPI000F01567D|nr:type II toxin-antitoxin system PemK/MazF family toxin [Pseudomonas viridiflava]
MSTNLTANEVGNLNLGDIIKVTLDPTVGHEQQEFRPCIVMSVQPWNNVIRGFVFVAPLTGTEHPNPNAKYPRLQKDQTDCGAFGTVLLDQIRSIDAVGRKVRHVGKVTDPQVLDDLRMAICLIMGVGPDFFPIEE